MNININHGFLVTANLINNSTGTSSDISQFVVDVMVRKRYLSDSFPLFVIDLRTTPSIRDEIRDNDCTIALTISYYTIQSSNGDEIDTSDKVAEGIVYDGNIRIYDKPFTTTTTKKDDDNQDNIGINEAVPYVYYRVAGIPDDLMTANEDVVGGIYKNATLADVLVNILSSTNIHNIQLQTPDNKELYNNIIIPPLSLVPAITFLDNNYRIYETGHNLFIDYGPTIYCYKPSQYDELTSNIFEYTVLSADASGNMDKNTSLTLDENNNIYGTYRALPAYQNPKDVISHAIGSETIFYSYDDFYNLNIRNESKDIPYKKVRYMWNPQKIKAYETDVIDLDKRTGSISLVLSSINPNLFTPLTTIRVISSEYKEPSGDYIIAGLSYIVSTTDGKHYNGNISLTCLKK